MTPGLQEVILLVVDVAAYHDQCCVAESLPQGHHIDPRAQGSGGKGVAELVGVDVDTRLLPQSVEDDLDASPRERGVTAISVGASRNEERLLHRTLGAGFLDVSVQFAAHSVLARIERDDTVLASLPLAYPNIGPTRALNDVVDGDVGNFTQPQSRRKHELHQEAVPLVVRRCDEPLLLLFREHFGLVLLLLGSIDLKQRFVLGVTLGEAEPSERFHHTVIAHDRAGAKPGIKQFCLERLEPICRQVPSRLDVMVLTKLRGARVRQNRGVRICSGGGKIASSTIAKEGIDGGIPCRGLTTGLGGDGHLSGALWPGWHLRHWT